MSSGRALDIASIRGIADLLTDARVFGRERVTVSNGLTRAEVQDVGGTLPPLVAESGSVDVARWELQKYITFENLIAKLARVPVARRRQLERETARRQRLVEEEFGGQCPSCEGTRYVQDGDGNYLPCPAHGGED